jgi:hypothetical protein
MPGLVAVEMPDRTVTDQYVQQDGRKLDYVFDFDLGEPIPGHRVIARGMGAAPKSFGGITARPP